MSDDSVNRAEELARDYAAVFDLDNECANRVMQDLGQMFGYVNQSLYDRSARDPGAEVLVRSGHQEVLQYIGAMMSQGRRLEQQAQAQEEEG